MIETAWIIRRYKKGMITFLTKDNRWNCDFFKAKRFSDRISAIKYLAKVEKKIKPPNTIWDHLSVTLGYFEVGKA